MTHIVIRPIVKRSNVGILLVATAALAWSTGGYFTRLIQTDTSTMIFWRGIFAGVVIALFGVWDLRSTAIPVIKSLGFRGWFITFCLSLGMIGLIPAFRLTSVANVTIVLATLPLVTAAIAWLWSKEHQSSATLLAGVAVLCGVAVMMIGSISKPNMWGEVLALTATVVTAVAMVAVRRYRDVPLPLTVCLASFVSAFIVWPFAAPFILTLGQLTTLALFGFIQAMGMTLFFVGSRQVASSHAALVTLIEAPLAVFWVWYAFGEGVTDTAAFGGAVVLVAVLAHTVCGYSRT